MPEDLEDLAAEAAPRDDCACAQQRPEAVMAAGSPCRKRRVMDATWSDGVGAAHATDVVVDVSRYPSRLDGCWKHVEGCETDAAAGGGSRRTACLHKDDGGHVVGDVRRLTSGRDVLPRNRLSRCSRGSGLGKDSPALRICMETTRAS